MSEPRDARAALVEQRVRLEERLGEFHRVTRDLGSMQLPAAAVAAVQRLKSTIARLDSDLTQLANVTHDLVGDAQHDAAAPIRSIMFVRVGEAQFGLPVVAVREIRSWRGRTPAKSWRDRDLQIIPLAAVLQVSAADSAESDHKLLVLESRSGLALLVDEVPRQDEMVVRPLGPLVPGPFSGAISLAHDELILVVDPTAIAA